ncbi:MAG: hypothetical protein ACP5N3_02860 [Candidatus Nanoarchaeia archaeon]
MKRSKRILTAAVLSTAIAAYSIFYFYSNSDCRKLEKLKTEKSRLESDHGFDAWNLRNMVGDTFAVKPFSVVSSDYGLVTIVGYAGSHTGNVKYNVSDTIIAQGIFEPKDAAKIAALTETFSSGNDTVYLVGRDQDIRGPNEGLTILYSVRFPYGREGRVYESPDLSLKMEKVQAQEQMLKSLDAEIEALTQK